jgi:hypothetical protein
MRLDVTELAYYDARMRGVRRISWDVSTVLNYLWCVLPSTVTVTLIDVGNCKEKVTLLLQQSE